MADAPDAIMFQEKGVFFSNTLEIIRAHQALATRFLALEGKGGSEGGAQEFTDLGKRIDDLASKLKDQDAEFDKLHAKIDKLFPDEDAAGPSQPAEPEQPVPEAPADSEDPEATPEP